LTAENPNKPANSRRDLARKCGVSVQSVCNWIKHPDWPFGAEPNKKWIPSEVLKWREQNLKQQIPDGFNPDESPPQNGSGLNLKTRAEISKIVEQTKRIRVQRQKLEGQLIDRDEAIERSIRQLQQLRQAMLAIPRAIATDPEYDDLDQDAQKLVERLVDTHIREALREFVRQRQGDAPPANAGENDPD